MTKRLILASLLTAAAVMAQSTTAPSGSAQTPQNTKATNAAKKHRHGKKTTNAAKNGTAPAVQSGTSQTPAKK